MIVVTVVSIGHLLRIGVAIHRRPNRAPAPVTPAVRRGGRETARKGTSVRSGATPIRAAGSWARALQSVGGAPLILGVAHEVEFL